MFLAHIQLPALTRCDIHPSAGMWHAQAVLRRDLYRAKDVNLKLAEKLTRLEAQAYSARSGRKAEGAAEGGGS